jgi:hypothetical protein
VSKADDDAAVFYADPANRAPAGPAVKQKRQAKLFVWENVLNDYMPGMIVVLAPNLEVALELADIRQREEMNRVEPEVIDIATSEKPKLWFVHGGG